LEQAAYLCAALAPFGLLFTASFAADDEAQAARSTVLSMGGLIALAWFRADMC